MSARARLAVASLAALIGAAGAASCSLGLDESLIDRGVATPYDGASPGDSGGPDTADGDASPPSPEGGACAKDDDCKTSDGCLAARCDLSRKACVYDVCRKPACNSAACDTAAHTCGAPKPYKYRAAAFAVGAPIGCGGALSRCFAAVHPLLFVGTADGVLAFDVTDPQATKPRQVPIVGLGFVPNQLLVSGSRVFFLGAPAGAGATSRVPLAWADVPADPFVAKLAVQSVLARRDRPAGEGALLFARQSDAALLLDTNDKASYPSAAVEPPLVEPLTLASTPIPFTAGTSPVATSGTRLVMESVSPQGGASFGLIEGAGGATPTNGGMVALTAAGPISGPQALAQSADGALLWHISSLTGPSGGPTPPNVRAAKAFFLVADGQAKIDAAAGVDTEVYVPPPPIGTPVAGPSAMLDAKTALVTTAVPGNFNQTEVQFVTREPLGVVKDRRSIITLPIGQLAAAGSNGLGYVLAVDLGPNPAANVYVFDPACAP